MTQPSTPRQLLVPVVLAAVLGTACSFDTRARPKHGDSSSGPNAVTGAPGLDAATAAPVIPTSPAAGAAAPVLQPPSGGGPASAGAAPPVVVPPDAATPPSQPEPATDAQIDGAATTHDAATTPDAAGGEGGADAMAGDAMTDGAKPSGAAFDPCHEHDDCDRDLWCTAVAWGMADAGGYCAALCPGASGEVTCPQPASGSLTAGCQPATALCELGSCERQTCPEGLRCAHIETPIGGGQVFSRFACRP